MEVVVDEALVQYLWFMDPTRTRYCFRCMGEETSQWRRGTVGELTVVMCNACRLREKTRVSACQRCGYGMGRLGPRYFCRFCDASDL